MKRTATAIWNGTGKEGAGILATQSGVLQNTAYDFKSRFEDGSYTNPEELVAAAHAGCFSMKLSFVLGAAGFTAESINTECTITLESGTITESHLAVTASVPGISAELFSASADEAKANCPISKLLNTNITMQASLV
ncbi:MAG: OsmC family peroxiredoxin [Chitinophagaceae bacterium]|nr:MAG: OsmC family peroxiredoxin [Chitinophagaceae bacterium]